MSNPFPEEVDLRNQLNKLYESPDKSYWYFEGEILSERRVSDVKSHATGIANGIGIRVSLVNLSVSSQI